MVLISDRRQYFRRSFVMYVLGVVLVLMFMIFIIVILQYLYASMRLNLFSLVSTAYVMTRSILVASHRPVVLCVVQQLECLSWHRDGTQFMSAHADGSYIVWSATDPTKPKEQAITTYGEQTTTKGAMQ